MKLFKKKIEVPMKKELWGVWISERVYDPNFCQRSWYSPYVTFETFDEAADWIVSKSSQKLHLDYFFDWQTDHYAVLRNIRAESVGYYTEATDCGAKLQVIRSNGGAVVDMILEKYEV